MPSRKELFIGGRWIPSESGDTIEVISPRTEEIAGEALEASSADVDAAVAAANQAFDGPWRRISFEDRVQVLEKARDGLGRRADQIAEAMEAEQGLLAAAARAGMIPAVMRMMDVAIDCARQVPLREVRRDAQGAVLVEQEPKGVVSAIVPFNGPLPIAVLKCAPALLAGCPVVLKASELTPLSVFYLAEAFEEAGLPDGMLNVVSGSGTTGQRMVEHPDVDMISFTGSTAVGRRLAEVAGAGLKNLSLELGGKSAAIVLDDADMTVVGQVVAGGTFASAGQYCRALTRTLAPRSRYDEVVESLAAVARAMTPGDRMGPLISAKQRDRVESYVAAAREEGARLVTGGRRPEEPAKGFYYEATVFADATNEMRFVREEIFGPVIAVIPYDGVDEAVAIANDNEYGLSGAVFSQDARAGLEVARRVRTGTTGVNLHGARSCAPCGGMKSSGIGQEHGPEGFLEFLTPKAILIPEDLAQDLEREGIPSRPTIR
jgi:aldehyde dehydrogenase (NAD+)